MCLRKHGQVHTQQTLPWSLYPQGQQKTQLTAGGMGTFAVNRPPNPFHAIRHFGTQSKWEATSKIRSIQRLGWLRSGRGRTPSTDGRVAVLRRGGHLLSSDPGRKPTGQATLEAAKQLTCTVRQTLDSEPFTFS